MEFVFPFNLPEEQRAEMERQQQLHEMSVSSQRHEVVRLFEELGDDQLATLRNLLGAIASQGEDAAEACAWYHGFTIALLHARGLCGACGERHDAVLVDPEPAPPEEPGE